MEITYVQPDQYCRLTSLPRARFDDMFGHDEDPSELPYLEKSKEAINEYLLPFLRPRHHCIECKSQLPGLFGRFTWGIKNGEGYCGCCGWPARAIHRLVAPNALTGEREKATLTFVLQYHPEHVRVENIRAREWR